MDAFIVLRHAVSFLCVCQVGSTSADFQPDERDPEVELVLTENDYTLKMWPYKFKAVRQSTTLHHWLSPHLLSKEEQRATSCSCVQQQLDSRACTLTS